MLNYRSGTNKTLSYFLEHKKVLIFLCVWGILSFLTILPYLRTFHARSKGQILSLGLIEIALKWPPKARNSLFPDRHRRCRRQPGASINLMAIFMMTKFGLDQCNLRHSSKETIKLLQNYRPGADGSSSYFLQHLKVFIF